MTHWYHLQKTKTAAAALALMLVSSSWTSVKAQISLNVSQTTLGAVIQKIQKQSKYQFTYDDNLSKMQVMNMGNYAHGNQPIQHAIYLYDYSGQPWKCQYWVRQVMDRLYTPTPDGYCGDEDNGQTSAWYVFSAMGFYPVCPGSGQYALGTPYFKSMKLHLENGLRVSIQSEGDGCYVDDMQMNGKKYDLNYLDLNSLRQGAQISFRLSEKPNLQRGILESDAPYSFSKFMK